MSTREQALALARGARSADEIERAMMVLASLSGDEELDRVRAELSERFDAITAGMTPLPSREMSRYTDSTRNPGADNW